MQDPQKVIFEFEDFRLDAENSTLWRDGELVQMPPKALETLAQLVAGRGEVVTREKLLDTVWKDTFVEEGNINYTVSLLRKALGNKDAIQTVPRRGYRFTYPVREVVADTNGSTSSVPLFDQPAAKQRRWVLALLILVGAVALTSFTMWYSKSPIGPASQRTVNSLAVLPLRNLNSGDSDDTFALSVADLLIARLGSLDKFSVRPIDSVMSFASGDKDPIQFGSKLKVDAVFTGTFTQENGRTRVSARVLDVRDGAQIWAGQFDEAETDIFGLQGRLAEAIALSISLDLTEKEKLLLAKRGTENAEAYRAYVRGRAIFDQRFTDKIAMASLEFQRAMTLDPTYALAYAGMADALSREGNQLTGPDAMNAYSKARSYAQRAIELDPESSEAFVAMGRVRRLADWDWKGSEEDFEKAIALNPNNADAHIFYGQMLGFLGRFDEALIQVERAIAINPISALAISARFAVLESKGDIDEALRLANEHRVFAPESPGAWRPQATFRLHKGDYAGVIEIGENVLQKSNVDQKWAWYSLLARAYSQTDRPDDAQKMLRLLEQSAEGDTKPLYSLAMNYAEMERIDDAIAALEKCYVMHEERMVWLNVEPRFANLRSDPRFRSLVERMNLAGN